MSDLKPFSGSKPNMCFQKPSPNPTSRLPSSVPSSNLDNGT